MSVFSVFRRSRQAAKEQGAKQEETKKEQVKIPYKHIPTHAAIDALSGGPASSRDLDRPRILEESRRRSALTARGIGMGGSMPALHHGLPRVHSSLSHVSYPAEYASPAAQLPRAYSFSGMPAPGWTHRGGEVRYNSPAAGMPSGKGKGVDRAVLGPGHLSRPSSRGSGRKIGEKSSSGSSSDSVTSQEDLEMRPVRQSTPSPPLQYASPSKDPESPHRMHPSYPRRTSDPNRLAVPIRPISYAQSRDGRSRKSGVGDLPPVPALPPMHFGSAVTAPGISLAPVTSTVTRSGSTTPPLSRRSTSPVADVVFEEAADEDVASSPEKVISNEPTRRRRSSKPMQFAKLETINSNISESVELSVVSSSRDMERKRANVEVSALPTEFDAAVLPAPRQPVLPTPKEKLSKKASSKPTSSRRWSFLSSKSTAVAV
ncbi:hypothetical protein QBC47DRAFT_107402 [Echria macrotheca]|uniref:Uncharacterized protein n=1 Tax=Echria macrotheca TaxID=438768 RepID=A0AAJ0BJK8_9PEZI|nr:hypothetical protein QBC47DRAFT_107402 [Echria macrotheca]